MDWLFVGLGVAVVSLLIYSLIRVRRRERTNHALADWAEQQPVIYSTRAFVRQHMEPLNWVDWNDNLGGGPQLIVRTHAVEISAPQGMILDSRTLFLDARKATMWADEVGWGGTPLNRKRCIRLTGGTPQDGQIDVALSPHDDFNGAWHALIQAGVQPQSSAP